MTTTRTIANRVRTALAWVDDHADTLPGGWWLQAGEAGATLHWLDREAADYTRSLLEREFGPGTDHNYGQTDTTWPPEGDRPELSVFHTTMRARCHVPLCTNTEGHRSPHDMRRTA